MRGSRQARAIDSRFGKREAEEAWKHTEVDALYQFAAGGVRVPKCGTAISNGVLRRPGPTH